jgi:uncharacterized protein (TIGR00255 family)
MTADSGVVSSMTGFARCAGGDDRLSWTWELKSVNSRNLDLRCRLPAGYEALEPRVRAQAPDVLARGNLQVTLSVGRGTQGPELRINRGVLEQYRKMIEDMQSSFELAAPSVDRFLALRGVVEEVETEDEEVFAARIEAMSADFSEALDALVAMRHAEGGHLRSLIDGRLTRIEELVSDASKSAAAQPDYLRDRLKAQVDELLAAASALPEDRLMQEAALLATKADVREELDRLKAHCAAARALLGQGGAVGRRLDFLCQEFNREANTLCSKSSDIELTRIGLDLKSSIEQMREQVQNIE